jgi:hypothetical protein
VYVAVLEKLALPVNVWSNESDMVSVVVLVMDDVTVAVLLLSNVGVFVSENVRDGEIVAVISAVWLMEMSYVIVSVADLDPESEMSYVNDSVRDRVKEELFWVNVTRSVADGMLGEEENVAVMSWLGEVVKDSEMLSVVERETVTLVLSVTVAVDVSSKDMVEVCEGVSDLVAGLRVKDIDLVSVGSAVICWVNENVDDSLNDGVFVVLTSDDKDIVIVTVDDFEKLTS